MGAKNSIGKALGSFKFKDELYALTKRLGKHQAVQKATVHALPVFEISALVRRAPDFHRPTQINTMLHQYAEYAQRTIGEIRFSEFGACCQLKVRSAITLASHITSSVFGRQGS